MSEIIEHAVAALKEKLGGESFPSSVKFNIGDEGAVRIEGTEVTADDSEADVTLSADVETFQGILEGEVNPTTAYMTGKLQLEGDMGVAMKLASLLA
ncbi:MAG: sterol carrier family protein [Alphaproteobacteria bacterium]|nr:MAG: sterol carrier family protein [Alphaproteobacteria bacterium]